MKYKIKICIILLLLIILVNSIYYISHNFSEKFSNNTSTKSNIIFSLTSLPSRLEHLVKNVRLIRDFIPNAIIHLNLPKVVHRLNEKWDINSLPDNIRNDDNIKIFLIDDMGPISKLLPTLKRVTNPNSVIITIDDDIGYSGDFLKKFANVAKDENKKYVLIPQLNTHYNIKKNHLMWIDDKETNNFMKPYINDNVIRINDEYITMVTGYTGVAYPRNIFTDNMLDKIEKLSKYDNCKTSDDLVISYVLYKNKINLKKIDIGNYFKQNNIQFSNNDKKGLNKQNHNFVYSKCFKKMINNY